MATRKNPQQAIDAARAALQRAQLRQRAVDTRTKIIFGGLFLSWLRDDRRVVDSLAKRLAEKPIRPQDEDAIQSVFEELRGDSPLLAGSVNDLGEGEARAD